jgi:hypothetical protein
MIYTFIKSINKIFKIVSAKYKDSPAKLAGVTCMRHIHVPTWGF